MKLLFDGDIVAFRCAAAAEQENEGIAKYYADKLIDDCVGACNGDSFQVFLTGSTNFRYQVYPEYKANRLEQERPRHLAYLRDYLVSSLGASISDGCEADDMMGIAQCASIEAQRAGTADRQLDAEETTIVTLDKDLLMIPGNHYSWEISGTSTSKDGTKKRWTKDAIHRSITESEGLRWFYTQVLTGDTADNIKGAAGIGPKKAEAILAGLETESEYVEAVLPHFSCEAELVMTAQCLWIWRKDGDIWKMPNV